MAKTGSIVKAKKKACLTIKQIKSKCEKLCKKIVNGQPCIVCRLMGVFMRSICKHHLIPKGANAYWKYTLQNLVPLCASHHMFSNVMAAHSTNSLAMVEFVKFLANNYATHYLFYTNYNKKNLGVKRTLKEWEELLAELEDYAQNEDKARELIYEL